ncbi:reverse transcriptase domain-containing protein [Tanacetum coccineum]
MPRRLAYSNSDKEASTRSLARSFSDRFSLESSGTFDTSRQTRSASKSQRTPSKNKEPSHLRRLRRLEDRSRTREKVGRSKSRGKRITRFKYHRREKLPRNIRVYEENKDLEDHLSIFSATAEQEEWLMPVWCKVFRQTLGGAARNWFDDLDPRSVDNFEELSQKFLEEFSQQKRYAKDPTEIHGIKRRQKEGLQAFMDRFKFESSHIKGVYASQLLCLVMVIRNSLKSSLTKYLRRWMKCSKESGLSLEEKLGEVICGSAEMSFSSLVIEEAVASGKLGHLVKDIRQNNQRNRSQGRNNVKVINMIRGGRNHMRPFEGERSGLTDELTFPAIPLNRLTDEPIILEVMIEDHQAKKVQISADRFLKRNVPPVGDNRPSSNYGRDIKEQNDDDGVCDSKVSFAVKRHNRKDRNEKPGVVGSTIHSMIKFPTNQGIMTMEISREALWECRQLEKVQGLWKEVQWHQREEKISRIREQAILRTKSSSGHGPNQGPMLLKKKDKENTKEILTISQEHTNQHITVGTTLTSDCKWLLTDPVVHKRRPMTSDGRQPLKERVFHWLKEGTIRKVQNPEWVANAMLVKLANGAWKVQVDYSSLNKVCAMDMYPFPEEGEGLASLMEYLYKCFLRFPK